MDATPIMSDLNYIQSQVNTNCAPLASPTFTGTPVAPTPLSSDNSTTLATTAYVVGAVIGKNMVINGDCSISQINGSTLTTPTNGSYSIDMFIYGSTQTSKIQSQQVFTSLNSLGATSSLQWSVLSSYSPVSTDYFLTYIAIEGYNFARCQFGTSNAKPVSLQFKVNASVSGTYSGAIVNYAGTRSYPFQYTVVSGVDTLIQIPNIPGDTGGSWVGATNAGAAFVKFDLGSGTNYKSTAGTWQSGNYIGVTGSTNLVSQTNGSTLTITDVQLEQSPVCTTFERKYWSQNLTECQRYLRSVSRNGCTGQAIATTNAILYSNGVPMRGPVPTFIPVVTFAISSASGSNITVNATPTASVINLDGSVVQINCQVASGLVAGNATVLGAGSAFLSSQI